MPLHDEMAPPDELAVVGILNLQVILVPEGDLWVAQALEFDYGTCGTSEEDVKQRFNEGLRDTIQDNLVKFGGLDQLLASRAPRDLWLELFRSQGRSKWRYSQVSFHAYSTPSFPFDGIRYVVPERSPSEEAHGGH